jgi:hypothetical protein
MSYRNILASGLNQERQAELFLALDPKGKTYFRIDKLSLRTRRSAPLPISLPERQAGRVFRARARRARNGRERPGQCLMIVNFVLRFHDLVFTIKTESSGVEPLSLEGSADYKSASSTGQSLSRLQSEEHLAVHLSFSFCASLGADAGEQETVRCRAVQLD